MMKIEVLTVSIFIELDVLRNWSKIAVAHVSMTDHAADIRKTVHRHLVGSRFMYRCINVAVGLEEEL